MKVLYKRLFTIFAAGVLFYALGLGYYRAVDGFFLFKTKTQMVNDPKWGVKDLNPEEKILIDKILSQKFTYLAKGRQCYAFVSEDQQYVLKLIKQYQIWPLDYLRSFYCPEFLETYRDKKIAKRQKKREKRYTSFKIAYDHLKEESGLVFVHLNQSQDLNKKVTIYDKLNRSHHIDMDSMVFILQKKAVSLGDYFENLGDQSEDLAEGKNVIDSFYGLLETRFGKRIGDRDRGPKVFSNYGVINKKVIFIDIGTFFQNSRKDDLRLWEDEAECVSRPLLAWLKDYEPELYPYCQQQVERFSLSD